MFLDDDFQSDSGNVVIKNIENFYVGNSDNIQNETNQFDTDFLRFPGEQFGLTSRSFQRKIKKFESKQTHWEEDHFQISSADDSDM